MERRFSAVDAAFHGFGIMRRDPAVFFSMALLWTGYYVVVAQVFVPGYAAYLEALLAAPTSGPSRGWDADTMSAYLAMMRNVGLITLGSYVLSAVMIAAVLRSTLYGRSRGGLLGLSLGMDELRVFFVNFIVHLVAIFAALVGYLAAALLMLAVIAVVGGGLDGDGVVGAAVGMILVAVTLAYGPAIWLGCRLAPASAASIAERRFVIFDVWSITKGRFWPLFGAHALLVLMLLVIYLVAAAAIALGFGVFADGLSVSDWEGLLRQARNIGFGPGVVGVSLVAGTLMTWFYSAWLAVGAVAYRDFGPIPGGQGVSAEPVE